MAEQLLNAKEVAARLGISRSQFWRLNPRLIAAGLKAITIPSAQPNAGRSTVRYQAASVDRLIDRAAKRGEPIC